MYVRITKGRAWSLDMEGHVFEVVRFDGEYHYVKDSRRVIAHENCEEVILPHYVFVDNETGLIYYQGEYYKLSEEAVESVGDTVLITRFNGKDIAQIREVRAFTIFDKDFRIDEEIDGDDYVDGDPHKDLYIRMIPVEEAPKFEVSPPSRELTAVMPEMVDHPSHYTVAKFETIEVIEEVTKGYEDSFVGYCVGNTQKYIARAPYKGKQLEDLKKAAKYLEFAIEHLERGE